MMEVIGLSGYNTVLLGEWFPAFQGNIVPHFLWSRFIHPTTQQHIQEDLNLTNTGKRIPVPMMISLTLGKHFNGHNLRWDKVSY
jgi:hypothetical protein